MINATGFTPIYYHTDYWDTNTSGLLIRRHRRPRKTLFTPLKSTDLPIPLGQIGRRRTTYFEFEDGTTATRVDDDWTDPDVSQPIVNKYCKGYTSFGTNVDKSTGRKITGKASFSRQPLNIADPTPPRQKKRATIHIPTDDKMKIKNKS